MRDSRFHDAAPQEIDFLPASFHQNRQRRRKAVWRRALLGVSLTLIVLGTVRQHQVRRDRLATLEEARQHAAALMERLGDPAALQARIDRLESRANLITRLRIRIAPTRLLAGVVATRPEYISFDEFRMAREAVSAGTATESANARASATGSPDDALPPEQRDLDRLAREATESAMFLHLSGVAPDDVTLSRYLVELEATNLFDEVKLLYTDEHRHGEYHLRGFRLRLRVRRPSAQRTPESSIPTNTPSERVAGVFDDQQLDAVLPTGRNPHVKALAQRDGRLSLLWQGLPTLPLSRPFGIASFPRRRESSRRAGPRRHWMPAFAGMTGRARSIAERSLLWPGLPTLPRSPTEGVCARSLTAGVAAGSDGDLTVETTGTVGGPCRNSSPKGVRS